MSNIIHRGGRRSSSPELAIGVVVCSMLLSACTDSVAPRPTGQIGGGNAAPTGFGNDIPIASGGPPVVGNAGGTSPAPPRSHDAPTASNDVAVLPDVKSVGDDFYEAAAEVGSKGPAGPPVLPDERGEQAVAKAAADHPPLATFDAAAAETLPTPNPATPYQTIVDPANGNGGTTKEQIELKTTASEIDRIRFSAPDSAQAVVASRHSAAGQPDRSRLDRYDLASGKHESRAELPDRAALLDVSPDGRRALVRLTFGLPPEGKPAASNTRLDVWELAESEGQHIVGWQLGVKSDGSPSVPVDAAFFDGDHVVTLDDAGMLMLWNLAEQKAVYVVDTGSRGPLLMTPGRKYFALFTGTTFAAFDAASGAFRGIMTPPRPTLAACRDVAFSPDGKQLAAVLRRPAQSLLCWNADAGRPAYEFEAPLGLGQGLHFGSDGYLVVGGVLFDVDRKRPTWLYVENANSRNAGTSPDRRHWIVAKPAFRETSLQAVEAPSEAVIAAIQTPANLSAPQLGPGDSVAVRLDMKNFTGDRKEFESQLARSLGQVLDARGLRLDGDADVMLDLKLSERRTGESISFNSTGIGGGEAVPAHEIDFTISVVGKDGKGLWSDTGRVPPSYFFAKEKDKSLEAVLLEALWQAAPAAIAAEIEESMPAYIRTPATENTLGQTRLWAGPDDISRPGGLSVASSGESSASEADAVESTPVRQPKTTVPVSTSGVRDLLVVSAPYGWLVTTSDDGSVRIWDPRTFRRIDEVRSGRAGATKLANHPNGNSFVFGTEDGQIRSYDLNRAKAAGGYDGASGAVTAVAFTSEPTLVAGTQGGRVYRWAEDSHSSPATIADGQSAVTGLASVPFSNRVVVAWADGTAKLLDVGTGDVVHSLDVQAGPVHAVAVSPEGQTAILATEAGGAVLVSLSTGKETARVGDGSTTSVAFRPDGIQFVTGNRLGRAVLWRTADQSAESRLEGAGGQFTSIVFSTNGQAVAAAVAGRRVVPVWDLSAAAQGGRSDGPDAAHDSPTPMRVGPRRGFGPGAAHGP
ncbi:MAG: hypothetical protein M3552_08205, partial [Planctomycetota bacterium]|nr:hypothetical protein [Planctomycetaceae bacterium]MDQ3330621.1 hypothetical protein [Planctomycetota bacterium]